jgi:hypothetical protein
MTKQISTESRSDSPKTARWFGNLLAHHPILWCAIAVGVFARLVFWLYTGRVWEDSLITITHAQSAVAGIGLTHHYGEGLVHGFTSALSVLVPLVGEVIWPDSGLFVLRCVSLLATIATIYYAYRITEKLNLNPWASSFALFYLALSQYQIFYGMAGMETQMAVAILLAGTYAIMVKRVWQVGICLGLGLLVRPDFVLWIGPALAYLLWKSPKAALRAAIATTAVAAPWFLFATLYYGSPIPHTVRVKSLVWSNPPPPLTALQTEWPGWLEFQATKVHPGAWKHLAPFIDGHFVLDTPVPLTVLGVIATVLVSLAILGLWTTRKAPGWLVAIAYVVAFVLYYFAFIANDYFSWYVVPFMALVVILAAAGLHRLRRLSVVGANALAILLIVAYGMHIPFSFPVQAQIQTIENRVRKPMSEYLAQAIPDGESVISESAGYVGYYSRAKLFDYPGLTSPTSVKALKQLPREQRRLQWMIGKLQSEWLVLRPREYEMLKILLPEVAIRYRIDKTFATDIREIAGGQPLPSHWGLSVVNEDNEFYVLRRQD